MNTSITNSHQDTTNNNNHTSSSTTAANSRTFHIGLYGWRKKCLYLLILGLSILIIVNLALTLWILKVMEFTPDGMGQLKVVPGGLQLTGQALVLDMLRASTIRSRHNQPLTIESSRNFSVNTRDREGYVENHFFVGHDRLECLANEFRVTDNHGELLFSADQNEVVIGANTLRVDGDGGIIFKESIQTPLVKLDAGKELRLESPTRTLDMRAAQDIIIQSRAGSLDANCLNDIKLHSVAGSIRLDASSIILPNIKTAVPPSLAGPVTSTHTSHLQKIYQLCVCSSGKLFLAQSHALCSADDPNVCR